MIKAIPEDYHSVTPRVMFKDARKAIEFYKLAFGAQERFVMPGPVGKEIMHAELRIGNSIIMMEEKCQQHPGKMQKPSAALRSAFTSMSRMFLRLSE